MTKDPIVQVDIALDRVNYLLAKSIAYKDREASNRLHDIRDYIYRGKTFDYPAITAQLAEIAESLKRYDDQVPPGDRVST